MMTWTRHVSNNKHSQHKKTQHYDKNTATHANMTLNFINKNYEALDTRESELLDGQFCMFSSCRIVLQKY